MANTAQKNSRYIYAIDACKAQQTYDYHFANIDLPRLAEFSITLTGDVEAKLTFFQDRLYKPYVKVRLDASIGYPCQRCFEDVKQHLQIDRELVVLLSDKQDEQNFAPEHEPIWLDEELTLDVIQVIEDEILLAVPSHPLHEQADCHIQTTQNESSENIQVQEPLVVDGIGSEQSDNSGETTRPFANLRDLLNKNDG